jgi:hypothetical protein
MTCKIKTEQRESKLSIIDWVKQSNNPELENIAFYSLLHDKAAGGYAYLFLGKTKEIVEERIDEFLAIYGTLDRYNVNREASFIAILNECEKYKLHEQTRDVLKTILSYDRDNLPYFYSRVLDDKIRVMTDLDYQEIFYDILLTLEDVSRVEFNIYFNFYNPRN